MASKRKTKGAPAIVPRFLKTAVTIGSIPALAAACAKPIQRQPPVVAYFAPPPPTGEDARPAPPVVAAYQRPAPVVAAYARDAGPVAADAAVDAAPRTKTKRARAVDAAMPPLPPPPPPPVVAALVAPPAVVAAYIPRDAAIPAPKKKPKRP